MDSWLLKFNRAEEHLAELNRLIGPSAGIRQPHPVTERFETYDGVRQWVYRLDMGTSLDDERLAIVVGDFLFNVRSGLDHRAVSLVPADQKHNASFPIFNKDPFAMDPNGPGHLNPQAWKAWKGRIRPFPESARAVLRTLQPFEVALKHAKPAEYQALEILRVLHDADEHQELVIADRVLEQVDVLVDGQIAHSPPSGVKDGTAIYASPDKVKVELIGAAFVGLGVGKKGRDEWRWPIPRAFNTILDHIGNEVLPALEKLIVYPA
jgi:hypothetical protein